MLQQRTVNAFSTSGLTNVGVRILIPSGGSSFVLSGARLAAAEIYANSAIYGIYHDFPDAPFTLLWDSGEDVPLWASETVNASAATLSNAQITAIATQLLAGLPGLTRVLVITSSDSSTETVRIVTVE